VNKRSETLPRIQNPDAIDIQLSPWVILLRLVLAMQRLLMHHLQSIAQDLGVACKREVSLPHSTPKHLTTELSKVFALEDQMKAVQKSVDDMASMLRQVVEARQVTLKPTTPSHSSSLNQSPSVTADFSSDHLSYRVRPATSIPVPHIQEHSVQLLSPVSSSMIFASSSSRPQDLYTRGSIPEGSDVAGDLAVFPTSVLLRDEAAERLRQDYRSDPRKHQDRLGERKRKRDAPEVAYDLYLEPIERGICTKEHGRSLFNS
jgi:hypothetical protein